MFLSFLLTTFESRSSPAQIGSRPDTFRLSARRERYPRYAYTLLLSLPIDDDFFYCSRRRLAHLNSKYCRYTGSGVSNLVPGKAACEYFPLGSRLWVPLCKPSRKQLACVPTSFLPGDSGEPRYQLSCEDRVLPSMAIAICLKKKKKKKRKKPKVNIKNDSENERKTKATYCLQMCAGVSLKRNK